MNRSGFWRKGVAFALILLMVFMAAAISAPVVEAEWSEGDPFYTYDYVMFSEQLERGAEASTFNITVGINWGDATPRDVPTRMTAQFICPDYGADHINIAFYPSTFNLLIGQTQIVEVAISAKETAEVNNYIIRIEGDDIDNGTPFIWGFISDETGWCQINPYVLAEGCFIATAAYGTSTAKELDTLRTFRDEVLLESRLGSQFVNFYYDVSPPAADFISEHQPLRTLVREFLVDPVVWVVDAIGILWRD